MVADPNWGSWFLAGDFAGTKEAQKRSQARIFEHVILTIG
jgi:hypothetical protein